MKKALPARAWSASHLVMAGGAAFVVLLLAATVALGIGGRRAAIADQLAQNELLARVLEDQVTRSFDTVAQSLALLANVVSEQGLGGAAMNPPAMAQFLASLPQLRALSMLDAQGRVVGSSVAGEVGVRVDLAQLGPLPNEGRDAIGIFIAGRSLRDIAVNARATTVPRAVGFIPVVRRAREPGGQTLYLVGLMNPEGIASQMRLTIAKAASQGVLATFDGRVLTATADALPGQPLEALPAFRDYLPRIEHASYQGAGVTPGEQTLAFRVSRTRPLVVLVERPLASVLDEWASEARWLALIVAAATLAVALLTWSAARSLRTREQVRQRFDLAQAEVAQRENELSVIVRSVQELLFRTDAGGLLTFVNMGEKTVAGGLRVEAVVGTRVEAHVLPAERGAARALFDIGPGAALRTATVTLQTLQGRARRFDVVVAPLYDASRIIGFAGSAVDITEREEAQARLAEQLAFSALLQEMSPLPTSMIDTEGRYLSVNRAWEEFKGCDRKEVLGRLAGDFLPPDEAREHEARDRHLLDRGGQTRYETSYIHSDGSPGDLLVIKVAVPGRDGKPQGILNTFMEMTEVRAAARATQEARDAAEESSRAKSEFVANISHELRTPLQSIIGFSELGTLRARGHDKLATMFADILTGGQRMLALVNDLLDVSKIESAVGTIHLERADLRPLLREVLRELEPLFGARHLAAKVSLPPSPLVAKVDPTRFQQVVRNVLANAIKFAPAGTAIVVDARIGGDGGPHISVRDRGPGIPAKEIEQIFDAFVQSSSTKDGAGGTGLGLAICRKIIDAHGGSIRAENMPDGGSRFHIHLPARVAGETRPAELAG